DIKNKIYSAKSKAILLANRLMIELYFEIGKSIIEKQEALGWGKSVVEQMSRELIDEFGEKSGYSSSNLWRMRNFYLSYKENEKLAQHVREISWGQNILIFEKCKSDDVKEYYIKNTIENGWNRNVLMHHIKTSLFDRDKLETKANNFEVALPTELSELVKDIVKSEYNLEYLEIAKNAHERHVENKLVENIKKFLLELGYGFSFIDNQYRLTLGENEYYIDLLFFHRKLNALVAIELKVGKFKPEYAGKMNFYLNLLNDKVKMPHENPSIGIILCTDKDGLEVEYALQSVVQPMGVSTYTVKETLPPELKNTLPSKEELQEKLKEVTENE
ncbi:MAG: PDDEXK nuclease domain-containing protein, partial [Sulfurimonas sp.]|nr:PDDEXK nuclease domain-containing protein [Sulfurimonas sp.]